MQRLPGELSLLLPQLWAGWRQSGASPAAPRPRLPLPSPGEPRDGPAVIPGLCPSPAWIPPAVLSLTIPTAALRGESSRGDPPVKETSASLSGPSSWMLSLSDLDVPRDRFMFLKYCPQRCLPASFFSLFSLALRFWNQTCGRGELGVCGPRPCPPPARPRSHLHHPHVQPRLR